MVTALASAVSLCCGTLPFYAEQAVGISQKGQVLLVQEVPFSWADWDPVRSVGSAWGTRAFRLVCSFGRLSVVSPHSSAAHGRRRESRLALLSLEAARRDGRLGSWESG